MTVERRELYRSANGDRWFLAREPGRGPFIVHEPNLPSGGRASRIEIGAFLGRGEGPEQQRLLELVNTLVEESVEAASLR